ncbi:MAG: GtrA family protein [Streptosporangiaceae bacterium]
MPAVPDKITKAAWRLVPAKIERKLRTDAGKRFTRFVPVAVAGVITSQVMLAILVGPVQLSAGLSGVLASMTAALVSYILSRWAWERKGRPDFLRETVPFWLVSAGVWLVLGLTSHYASVWAHSMHYTHWRRHLAVQGAYFLMNCVTFVTRFLIFHYLLFKKKDGKPAAVPEPELATADAAASANQDTGPIALLTGDSPTQPQGRHRA